MEVEEDDPPDIEPPISNAKVRGKYQQGGKDNSLLFTTIQTKLSSVYQKDSDIAPTIARVHQFIQENVLNLSKIALEAQIFANFHLIRCLRLNKPLPLMNQSFFYSCCALMTDSKQVESIELNQSYGEYKPLRPNTGYVIPHNDLQGKLMDNLSITLETSAQNHIILNFSTRLVRYVRLRYHLDSRKEAEYIVRECLVFGPKRQIAQDIAEWLEFQPLYKQHIEKNIPFFLRKLDEMLQFIESLPQDTKGRKSFSLLPLKQGFQMIFIMYNRQELDRLCQQLSIEDRRTIVGLLLDRVIGEDECHFLQSLWSSKTVRFEQKMMRNEWICSELWNLFFDTKQFETANRKFAYGISTDGYTVSLRFQKHNPTPNQEIKRKYSEKKRKKPAEERTEDDENEDGYDMLPTQEELKSYSRFIGIDPGVTNLITSFDGVDYKGVQISTKEYRHLAKTTEFIKWEKRLREREKQYREYLQSLPTLKTSNLVTFKQNVTAVLTVSDWLLQFCQNKPFRKWRFKRSIYDKKTLHTLCKRVVPDGKKTLVGFGDWSQQDGVIKKKPKAPVKKFRKELRNYATVVRIDEFRTSKTCSGCGHKEDMFHVKHWQRGYCRREGCKKMGLFKSHEVVRCQNCMKSWQRDHNAARNMFTLLMCKVKGEERPEVLSRKKKISPVIPSRERVKQRKKPRLEKS
jgi:transposase